MPQELFFFNLRFCRFRSCTDVTYVEWPSPMYFCAMTMWASAITQATWFAPWMKRVWSWLGKHQVCKCSGHAQHSQVIAWYGDFFIPDLGVEKLCIEYCSILECWPMQEYQCLYHSLLYWKCTHSCWGGRWSLEENFVDGEKLLHGKVSKFIASNCTNYSNNFLSFPIIHLKSLSKACYHVEPCTIAPKDARKTGNWNKDC